MVFAISGQGRHMKALRRQGAVEASQDEFGTLTPPVKFWFDSFETHVNGARKAVGDEKAAQYEQEDGQMRFEKVVEYAQDFELN